MSGFYIALIIIGLVCVIGSFFLSEKLSSSDMEEISKLSEKEIKIIIDKELSKSSDKIKEAIDNKIEDAYEDLDRKTDKETNEKIRQISEYSDTVLESMNNSHEEIKFMYSMLTDKQNKLKDLQADITDIQSNIILLKKELEEDIDTVNNLGQVEFVYQESADVKTGIEAASKRNEPEEVSFEEMVTEKISEKINEPQTERDAINKEIVDLYNEGMTEVDIAKKLGKGIGEIKLVLGLFK